MLQFIVIILAIVLIVRYNKKKKAKRNNLTNTTPRSDAAKKIKKNPTEQTFDYDEANLYRVMFQTLESLEILRTTRNIETFISRYKFLRGGADHLGVYEELESLSKQMNCSGMASEVVTKWQELYYDKELPDTHKELLLAPSLPSFRHVATLYMVECYNRFTKTMEAEADKLKREDAKQRRWNKIVEMGDVVLRFLDTTDLEPFNLREVIEKNRELLTNSK